MLDQQRPWSDQQLDEAIWELSEEFTEASMVVYSRAVEYGRTRVPAGPAGTLLAAMRESLRRDPALKPALPHFRPERPFVYPRPDHSARSLVSSTPRKFPEQL